MSDKNNPEKSRIVSLFIGFLILFVVTFSLGIIVGKGLTERSVTFTENIETVQPRFPGKTVENENDEALVFQERVDEPDAATEEPPKQISPKAPDEVQVKEDIKEEPAIEISKPAEPPKDQKAESEKKKSLAKSQTSLKSDPVREKPVTNSEPQKKTPREAIEEIAKTDQNKKESRVKLPPIDPGGSYTVQIGSFTDKKAADSVLNSMKNKGYPAYISTMRSSDNTKWYRVRIGTFGSSQAANDYGANLKRLEPEVKIVFVTQNK